MAEKKNIFERMGLLTKEKFNVPWWQVFTLDNQVREGIESYTYGKKLEKSGKYNDYHPLTRVTYEKLQLTNKGKLAFTTGFATLLWGGFQIAKALNLIP